MLSDDDDPRRSEELKKRFERGEKIVATKKGTGAVRDNNDNFIRSPLTNTVMNRLGNTSVVQQLHYHLGF